MDSFKHKYLPSYKYFKVHTDFMDALYIEVNNGL